ncbi:MAG: hypothetical protein HY039_01420 [Nitrospirae bacterium]|nr:hypothetical protein [Nitrospirota bacterium]
MRMTRATKIPPSHPYQSPTRRHANKTRRMGTRPAYVAKSQNRRRRAAGSPSAAFRPDKIRQREKERNRRGKTAEKNFRHTPGRG